MVLRGGGGSGEFGGDVVVVLGFEVGREWRICVRAVQGLPAVGSGGGCLSLESGHRVVSAHGEDFVGEIVVVVMLATREGTRI